MSQDLLGFLAAHLRDPLIHVRVFLLERLLELLASGVHRVSLLPVCEAIVEYLSYICEELFVVAVFLVIHLHFDRAKIHWSFDLVQVIRYSVLCRLDGVSKGANESRPEAWASSQLLHIGDKTFILTRSRKHPRE